LDPGKEGGFRINADAILTNKSIGAGLFVPLDKNDNVSVGGGVRKPFEEKKAEIFAGFEIKM